MNQNPTDEGIEQRVKAGVKQNDPKILQSDLATILSPELLYHLFESIHVPITVTSVEDGLILYANKSFVDSIGYDGSNELLGKHTTELKMWADPEERKSVMDEIQKNGFVQDREILFRRPSGMTRTCLFSAQGIEIDGKEYLMGTAVDITERKKTEDELRKYHDQLTVFKQFAEKSNQGMGWADLDGRIVYINSALSRMFGVQKPEDVYGKPVQSTFYPKSIEKRLNEVIFPTVMKEGKWQGESEIRTEHGKSLPSYESLFLIRDKDENPLYFANVLSDITERKKTEEELKKHRDQLEEMVAVRTKDLVKTNEELRREITERKRFEKALQESEDRFRSLVESISDWIWEVDQNCVYTYTSPKVRDLLGYELEEVIGKTPFNFMPLDEAKRVEKEFKTLMKAKFPFEGLENLNMHKDDGRLVVLETSAAPIFDAEGQFCGYRGIDRDITERKRTHEIMVQTEKMMTVGGLAAGMAHEINNPLAGIMQNLQVIKNRMSGELPKNIAVAEECGTSIETIEAYMEKRELFEMIDLVMESGKRAAKIVDNMLSFSRKSEDRLAIHSLCELLDKTIELAENEYDLKKKFDFRQIEILREYDDSVSDVTCEASKIQQVFLNILMNAAQAMTESKDEEETPRIILRVMQEGDMARVEIEDNGPGIDEDTRKRVFEPFFTTKGIGLGTGLGLSVSYFIITENHGGTIAVNSTPGEGAKYIIRLPIERDLH